MKCTYYCHSDYPGRPVQASESRWDASTASAVYIVDESEAAAATASDVLARQAQVWEPNCSAKVATIWVLGV